MERGVGRGQGKKGTERGVFDLSLPASSGPH